MKKFLLGLMAFVGMAVCFTACGDKEDNPTPKQEKTAEESGASLYNSYKAYKDAKAKNDNTNQILAATDLYLTYQAFQNNKENNEWKNEFAKSAASAAVSDKTDIDPNDKEAAKEAIADQLKTKLTDGSLLSEDKTKQAQSALELYEALDQIFN